MKGLAALGALVLVIGMSIVSYIINGYVLSVMWRWFIVPIFNLPQITITVAIGISIVVGYLTHQDVDCVKPERSMAETVGKAFGRLIAWPFVILFVGWIVHQFM